MALVPIGMQHMINNNDKDFTRVHRYSNSKIGTSFAVNSWSVASFDRFRLPKKLLQGIGNDPLAGYINPDCRPFSSLSVDFPADCAAEDIRSCLVV